MVRWNQDKWTNWAGDVVVERPERRYYPTTRYDLVTIVLQAEKHDPPRRVRACGSHWAFSDAAVSDWLVETSALRGTLYNIIPQALNDRARRELLHQSATAPAYSYYHVEAGITIRDLNRRLDRQPLPAADRKWARMPTDALDELWVGKGRRWALPTMGGAGGQALAGAISTGTHGGDHRMPPMADMVEAIHLVGPGGRQLWIERDAGITDPDRLRHCLPEVEHHTSTELFNAVLVSVGRMGIIYAFVIRVVEQFWLEQVITASSWEEQSAGLRDPFPVFERARPAGTAAAVPTRFVEAVVVPYARRDGRHTCYLTSRWIAPAECHSPKPKYPDFFAILCRHRRIAPVVLALIALVVLALGPSAFIPVIGPALVVIETLVLAVLAGLLTVGHLSLGELVAHACNFANRTGRSWLVRKLLERVMNQFRPRERKCDVGYEIMDLEETGGECYRADSMEASFDARSGAHIDFLDEDLFPAFANAARSGHTVAGYVSLRFTKKSAALLAMQRWDVTCSIEIALLQGIDGNNQVLHALEAATVKRGGTIHWGQRNRLDAEAVAKAHPDLDRWRSQLARLIGHGSADTFDNAFCRTRGLEP